MNTPPKEDGEGDPVASAADISASISFGDDEDMAAWANVSAAVTEAVLGTAANDTEGPAAACGPAGKEKGAEDEGRAATKGMVSGEDPMMPVPEESRDSGTSGTMKTSVIQERNEAIHTCTLALSQF